MQRLQQVARAGLPTRYGTFQLAVYGAATGQEHLALIVGDIGGGQPVPVRLHAECLAGDAFGSCRCDCGEQLDGSLRSLQDHGRGLLLYLRQEGRGSGLADMFRAHALRDQGRDGVEADRLPGVPEDLRDYGAAAEILRDLGVRRVRLLTNSPATIAGLERHGIAVVERQPLQVSPNPCPGWSAQPQL